MTNTELLSKIKDFANEQKELLKGFELQSDFRRGEAAAYSAIISFLSTLESEKPISMEVDFEKEIEMFGTDERPTKDDLIAFARRFYELGCRRTAEKYDEIEYNRQREEESEKPMNPNELEKEIEEYFPESTFNTGFNYDDLQEIARHFAQWGAEHTPLPEDTVLFNKGVEEGKRLMMEEAVEAIVEDWNPDPEPEITIPLNPEEFTCGDKVRIIIIKEEKNGTE